jgi:Domain of unknown function DUF29
MSDSETKARPNSLYESDFYTWRNYQKDQLTRAYRGARLLAANQTGIAIGLFPEECPFNDSEVLDLGFFPEDRAFE